MSIDTRDSLNEETAPNERIDVVLPVCDELFGSAVIDFVCRYSWPAIPTFHLLFVIELGASRALTPDMVPDMESDECMYGARLIDELSRKIRKHLPDSKILSYMPVGKAAAEILKLAERVHADMIVMGSHGRTGLRRVLLGSVSGSVVERAKCSTVVVRIENSDEILCLPNPPSVDISDLPTKMTSYAVTED